MQLKKHVYNKMILKFSYLPKADRTIPEVRKREISLHKLCWCRKKGEKEHKNV